MTTDNDTKQPIGGQAEPEPEGKKEQRTPLATIIREQVTEGESPQALSMTLRKILGGDFLTAVVFRKQIWLIVLIAVFTMVYVSNRYSCQKDMIEIDRLEKSLQDAKFRALASTSELTELCRESNVLKMLKNNEDSLLKIANQPPYIINVPDNE